jgi:hypothetical protein
MFIEWMRATKVHGASKVQFSAHFCLLSVGFSLKEEGSGLDKTRQKQRERLNVKLISVKSVRSK